MSTHWRPLGFLVACAVSAGGGHLLAQQPKERLTLLENTEAIWRDDFNSVKSVAFTPDGKKLVMANYDGTIQLWDVARGRNTAILRGHTDMGMSVAFSPDGKTLASGSSVDYWIGVVKLWDMAPFARRK